MTKCTTCGKQVERDVLSMLYDELKEKGKNVEIQCPECWEKEKRLKEDEN